MFGMGAGETRKAVTVLKALGDEWRELVAGKEGFLTDEKSAGLRRQKVVWGEMDSMVRMFSLRSNVVDQDEGGECVGQYNYLCRALTNGGIIGPRE